MITYKFAWLSPEDSKEFVSVDLLFQELPISAIQSSIMYSRCLKEIENAIQAADGVLQSKDSGATFSLYDLGQGIKSLICAELMPDKLYRLDSIGENLYPLLEYFTSTHDLHLIGIVNPFELAKIQGVEFYTVYLDQFNVTIETSGEFEQYKQRWIKLNGKLEGLEYLLDWNSELNQPLTLSWNNNPSFKSIPEFELTLRHKFNFIQSKSSEGKTLLLRSILRLYSEGFLVSEYEPMIFSGTVMNTDHKTLVLVDMDASKLSLEFLHGLSETSDNMIYLFVGHYLTDRVKVPWTSVYTTRFHRRENKICISPISTLKAKCFDHFDVVICEDAGSGMQIWADSSLAANATLVSAKGYSGILENAELYVNSMPAGTVLVVADYSTAGSLLSRLSELQQLHSGLQVITPTSTEFILLYLCDHYTEYLSNLNKLASCSKDQLAQVLYQYGKSAVTLETIDFIVYCYVFGFVSEKDAKSYKALMKVNPDLNRLSDLLKFESKTFELQDSLHNPEEVTQFFNC